MSYDYQVICSRRPDSGIVEELVSTRDNYCAQGRLSGEESNCLVERASRGKALPAFTLDGPWSVEWEDVDESIAAVVLAPRWLVEVSIPAAAIGKDRSLAKSVAQAIAKKYEGALYDPQEDSVLWPKSRPKSYRAPVEEQRIRLVNLEWFLPFGVPASESAPLLLALLRRYCPEAEPTRFGTFEPLQHKSAPGDDSEFLRVWSEVASAPYGDSFFWKAKSPCFGGSVGYCDPREDHRPERGERFVRLSVDFDGRALEGEARWCEVVVSLFRQIASEMAAFYAAAYVERNVIAKRSIWYDGESESIALMRSRWWVGLPSKPTWLAWYGGPYSDQLRARIATVEDHATGVLLRNGELPLDTDQLKGVFPKLPKELIVRYNGDEPLPANVIPDLGS